METSELVDESLFEEFWPTSKPPPPPVENVDLITFLESTSASDGLNLDWDEANFKEQFNGETAETFEFYDDHDATNEVSNSVDNYFCETEATPEGIVFFVRHFTSLTLDIIA